MVDLVPALCLAMGRRDRSEVSTLPVKSVRLYYRVVCDSAGEVLTVFR